MICTVETDMGITGIGEGGSKDTLEQCAGTLIGKDPFKIEAIWQEMYIAWFYPPGREKTHAMGAMDMALWDIKGKALKLPVHELLGGTVRNHCECYGTTFMPPAAPGAKPDPLRDRAKAAMDAGYRAFRMGAADLPIGSVYNQREAVNRVIAQCKEVREGVGPNGDWCIDFHQRFDLNDALRACRGIEEYQPYFVEDPVRDEHALMDLPKLRQMTTVPLTHGEEWGNRWDFNKLVENHDIDYIRATLPERRRHHRDDEDRGHLRDARRRDRPALHRTDRDRGARELPLDVLRSGDDGVQLRRPPDRLPARVPRVQGRQGLRQPAPRSGRDDGHDEGEADRRGDAARPPEYLQASRRIADALVEAPLSPTASQLAAPASTSLITSRTHVDTLFS